ncbi:enterobactin synthase subunit EntD [Enterobacteriaceae bacterium 89]|nr:enterobactin synthase subunit EntD [Enterobacteriaceae bacterium 89]
MNIQHTPLPLAGQKVHRIDFTPQTFTETDLLWLPHHRKLSHAGKKRKAEHLAGRIAAFYALGEHGLTHIPDIGDNRQPLWPVGWHGGISHCGSTAIAVVSQKAVGIDLEEIFSASVCDDVAAEIINANERETLAASVLPFPLALTLAFSAKESLYKALSSFATPLPGFHSAEIIAIDAQHLTLEVKKPFCEDFAGQRYQVAWQQQGQRVITLLAETFQLA